MRPHVGFSGGGGVLSDDYMNLYVSGDQAATQLDQITGNTGKQSLLLLITVQRMPNCIYKT